jgi:lipopolysaccharide export system protein LptC
MYSHIERGRPRVARLSASRLLAWLSLATTLALVGLLAYQAGTFSSLVPEIPSDKDNGGRQVAAGSPARKLTVSQSRFTGFDQQRQPFSVTATSAVQDAEDANKVRLKEVEAQLKRKSGEEVSISSQNALYDANSKTIDLEGHVVINSADGFVAKMEKARVDIEAHRLRSEVPVEVVSPSGIISSNGMEIIDDGARILFFNGVKARFGGDTRKGSLQ